jgi:uncharacterized protein
MNKPLVPACLAGAAALLVVAQSPKLEEAPPGTTEKVREILPDSPYAKPEKPRKLLVFSRTNGFRHASIATGKITLAELGTKTGAFETIISDDLANFEPDTLATFDAVCFLSTTLNVFAPHPKELEKMNEADREAARAREMRLKDSLMRYVKGGGGFVGIHAATDTFYEWREYGEMLNGFFDGHPWNANTQVKIDVEPGEENHPLVKMFGGKSLEFKEEIYQFKDPYNSKAVHMLLRLDRAGSDPGVQGVKRTDNDFGVAWARHWEKGRVFYCSLGHNHEMYWHPEVVRHYLAGIQWTMGDLKAEVRK